MVETVFLLLKPTCFHCPWVSLAPFSGLRRAGEFRLPGNVVSVGGEDLSWGGERSTLIVLPSLPGL